MVKDSVDETEAGQSAAMASFLSAYNTLEKAARAHDWNQFTKVADVESFAEYFLIQEMTYNVDGYHTSVFFYKDGDQDVIHAGPIWDYDRAFGNPRNPYGTPAEEIYTNYKSAATWEGVSIYYKNLMETDEFYKTKYRALLELFHSTRYFCLLAQKLRYLSAVANK